MELVCPRCQSKITFNEAEMAGLMAEITSLAAKFGQHWELMSEYVDCFRQDQHGRVTLKKKARLLKEILAFYQAGKFQFGRRQFRVSQTTIRWAMKMIVDLEKYGFTNHNYLKVVLIRDGNAEKLSAEGLTAKEEQAREERRRGPGVKPTTEHGLPKSREPEDGMTAEEFKARQGIKSLAERATRKMED